MVNIVVSFIAGLLSSCIIWWITYRLLSPKLDITNNIAKTRKGKFLIGIRNASRRRDIYDISVYVRYHFASDNYYASKLEHIALLKKSPKPKCRKLTCEMIPFATKIILRGFKNQEGKLLSIEDFFEESNNKKKGFIDVFAIGYDIISGSTRHVMTKRYFHRDLMYDAKIEIGNDYIAVKPDNEESDILISDYDYNNKADI